MIIISKNHHLMDASIEMESAPKECTKPLKYSFRAAATNLSKSSITSVTLAYLAYDADFWAAPVLLAKELKPGKTKIIDLSGKKIRIKEFALRFTIDGNTYREDYKPAIRYFYGCMGVDVYKDKSFAFWDVKQPLPK